MEISNTSKQAAKSLLLAELVYRTAREKHRQEKTELSRRVVAEAQRQYLETQRDVMLASWNPATERLVSCPRCREPTLVMRWRRDRRPVANASRETKHPPQPAIPGWAQRYAIHGVASATRYNCKACGFDLVMIGPSRSDP